MRKRKKGLKYRYSHKKYAGLFPTIFFIKPRFDFRPVQETFNRREIICQYNQPRYTKYPSLEYGYKPAQETNDKKKNAKQNFKCIFDYQDRGGGL